MVRPHLSYTELVSPRLRTKLRLMLNLEQLPLTNLHRTHDPKCRRRHRLHNNSRTCRNHNAPRIRRILARAESFLDLGRRIGRAAACPSHHSSVGVMQVLQVLPPRRRNPRRRLPQTRHYPTVTACSHPPPDALFYLERDLTLLRSVGNHPLTGRCMAATPREHRRAIAFLPALLLHDLTAITTRRI